MGLTAGIVAGQGGESEQTDITASDNAGSLVPTMRQGDEVGVERRWRTQLVLYEMRVEGTVLDVPPTAPLPSPAALPYVEGPIDGTATITFYACFGPNGGYCAHPAGPRSLAEGQAACGAAWPMGTALLIEGDPLGPVVCNDLGYLGFRHVDRFFWNENDGWAWLKEIGSDYGTIILVGD